MPPPLDSSQRFHKPIRLAKQHYLGPRAYFLTLCAHDRIPYFRSSRIAKWLVEFPIFGPIVLRQNVQTQNHISFPRHNRKNSLANFFL